jgi:hypothetical protein
MEWWGAYFDQAEGQHWVEWWGAYFDQAEGQHWVEWWGAYFDQAEGQHWVEWWGAYFVQAEGQRWMERRERDGVGHRQTVHQHQPPHHLQQAVGSRARRDERSVG